MRIIKPITVDATTLKYSSISETDDGYPEWEGGYVFNEHIICAEWLGALRAYYKSGSTHSYTDIFDTNTFTNTRHMALNPSQEILLVYGEIGGTYGIYKYQRSKTSAGVYYNYVGLTDLVTTHTLWGYVTMEWSHDGRFLAVGDGSVFALHVFYFDGESFARVTLSGTIFSPFNYLDISFSKEDKFLATQSSGASGTGKKLRIYEVINTSFFSERALDSSIDDLAENGFCAFSPADNILFRAGDASDLPAQVLSYDDTGTFAQEDSAVTNISSRNYTFPAFSEDGRYLAIGSDTAPFLYFYEWDGSSFSSITAPTTAPTASSYDVKFSKTDYHCYFATSASPYLDIYYPDSSGVFQQITGPASAPPDVVREILAADVSTWALKSVVQSGNYLYESLKNGNLADPSADVDIAAWIEISPINRWKMFDEYANTSTTEDGQITVQIEAEDIAHIGLLGMSGASAVTVTRYSSLGVSQWTTTEDTTGVDRIIIDLDQATVTGQYVEVVIGSVSDTSVSVARCFPGETAVSYPNMQYGLEYSPQSFGKTTENDYGNVYLKQGNYADEFDCQVVISNTSLDTIMKMFRDYRETNLMWDLNGSTTSYEYLITYGFYLGRPRIVLSYPDNSIVNFKIREFT